MSNSLESWKQIADYLEVDVRTAQRWEKELGLPVHRDPNGRRMVVAYRAELDQWRRQAFQGPAWYSSLSFLRRYAMATTSLLLVLVGVLIGVYWQRTATGLPAGFRVNYRTLVVTDASGRELWRHLFDDPVFERYYSDASTVRRFWFGDLDGDGSSEVLFHYQPETIERDGTRLVCFGDRGLVRWTFVPGRAVADRTRNFLPIYLVFSFLVDDVDGDGRNEILVSSHQLDSHPNQFAVLDTDGTVKSEYWHSGHLPVLTVGEADPKGKKRIYLGGINNGYKAASLVVLDPDRVRGASTQAAEDPFQLTGFQTGGEMAYVVFPRTCVNQLFDDYNGVRMVTVAGNLLRVKVAERLATQIEEVIFDLDRSSFEVTGIRFSQPLRTLHRQLSNSGRLNHDLSEEEVLAMNALKLIYGPQN